MRHWHMLRVWLRSLLFRGSREADLREELQFHLECERERLEETGLDRAAADFEARRTFGGVEPTKEACREARRTALIDDLLRDVRFAGRTFRRTPLVALAIVMTVGLGLGLVAAVFTLLNAFIFRVDDVRQPHELFALARQGATEEASATFTRQEFDALLRDTGVFSEAFARTPDVDAWIEGRRMEGTLVTGNFFHVLGVSAAHGRTFTPADDQPGGAPIMVLSHRAWVRAFASDTGVLGRTVLVNGTQFQVVGVMPDGFRGLGVAPMDFWAPLSLVGEFRSGADEGDTPNDLGIVGRVAPGVPRGHALAQLQTWEAQRAAARGASRPTAHLVLEPRTGTVPQPIEAMVVFMPLFVAFGLILMIGCANVANLLLARAVARQREIGVRLAIGASRRRIIRQLLTEGILLSLLSAGLGFWLSRLVLAAIVYALTSTWSESFGDIRIAVPPADWRVALFLVAGAVVSTVFFALAPALQATRVEVVRAIRGEVVRDARPGRARDALVALQVTASVVLLVCAAIFLRSTWAAATIDPGIRTADTVAVAVLDQQQRDAVLHVVRSEPSVAVVAASWPVGLDGRNALAVVTPPAASLPPTSEGNAAGTGAAAVKADVSYQFVSPEYFAVLGIDVVRGRGFGPSEQSADSAVAIVADHAAGALWPGVDPLGQVLRLEHRPDRDMRQPDDVPLPSQSFVVVGITRSVPGFRLGGRRMAGADVYLPIDVNSGHVALTLRVQGDPERARRALIERMAAVHPNMAEVVTLLSMSKIDAYLLGIPFWLTLVLGALALLLTVSGLFSVLSYLVEQRTREIGVRMALGATGRQIGTLVLAQSARPVGLGLLVGASLTAMLGAALLATPVGGLIAGSIRLFDPVAYAASLICIAVACAGAVVVPARRAGRIEPSGALRQQ